MHGPNVDILLNQFGSNEVVLDIGGWGCPFNRANFVMDAQPYETRGYYRTFGGLPSQGGEREHFTRETWLQRDICDHKPWPFADKQFDFVICSHTLEDIRDPLWVCAEMIRVGKRGYLEVPSRNAESSRGWEAPNTVGLSHHRWLIDIDAAANSIRFLMKYHMIHSQRRFSFPRSFFRSLSDDQRVQWLFWNKTFAFSETTLHGFDEIATELEHYVARAYAYPNWMLRADRVGSFLTGSFARVWQKVSGYVAPIRPRLTTCQDKSALGTLRVHGSDQP